MARLTRKELKTDRFALEVQHSVEYVSEHRRQLVLWGGIGAAAAILIAAFFLYRSHERSVRQEKLANAMTLLNAQVGPSPNRFAPSFPTEADRGKAVEKAFGEVATKYAGTTEGDIAEFYLAAHAADAGRIDEASKRYKIVVDSGKEPYASEAKLSLAQIYASQGKVADGEKLIQSIIDHPTELVSKEEAIIAMAQLIAPTDPARARKLLEPLRGFPRSAVSRAALNALSDLDQQKK